ncbi:MAG: helix-turn-helix transcriptional regulator [Clostridia bacterium]
METIDAIKNRILFLCHERNITINHLADICGIPHSSIKNVLYGKSLNPKILTIKMICDGLEISLGEFFATKEFENLDSEIK